MFLVEAVSCLGQLKQGITGILIVSGSSDYAWLNETLELLFLLNVTHEAQHITVRA